MRKRDLISQVKSFSKLTANWNSYDALSICPACIELAVVYIEASNPMAVVPTVCGGVQLEYRSGIEVEIHPPDKEIQP